MVPFTDLQLAIYKNCDESYAITIMRRMMYRIAQRHGAALFLPLSMGKHRTGMSQTLESMQTINCVTTTPVIRPVACMDKVEIINVSVPLTPMISPYSPLRTAVRYLRRKPGNQTDDSALRTAGGAL